MKLFLTFFKMYFLLIFFSSSLLFHSCFSMNDNEFAQAAHNYLTLSADQKEFSGSVIIAVDDTVILRQGYGLANNDTPNSPATRFCIGSITKSFTALLVLLLAQEKLINIDDPVKKYIPEFNDERVTIHHLLTMTSGLPRDFWSKDNPHFTIFKKLETEWGFEYLIDVQDSQRSLDVTYSIPLRTEPGKEFYYSNIGFILLGELIRRVDHYHSYEQSVQKRIFVPLGLSNSFVCSQEGDSLCAQRIAPPFIFGIEENYGGSFDHGTVHSGGVWSQRLMIFIVGPVA